jgi:hypothetical protein
MGDYCADESDSAWQKRHMPRRSPDMVRAVSRATEGRRAVVGQLVETLKASGKPSRDAEDVLQTCISALELLERHERRFLEERREKARQARKTGDHGKTVHRTSDRWQLGISPSGTALQD